MNSINIDDIALVFKEDDSLFSEVGVTVDVNVIETDLNIDSLSMLHKKSMLSDVALYLTNKYNLNEDKFIKKILKGVSFFTLMAVHPKSIARVFIDENNFEELRACMKSESGMQYFSEECMQNNASLKTIVDILVAEKYFTKRDDRFYLKGYYLNGLKCITL